MPHRAIPAGLGAMVLAGLTVLAACQSPTAPENRRAADLPVTSRTAEADGPGPRTTRHGVGVGWPQDKAGARAAAVAAVRLTGPIARAGFITRGDMIGVLATDAYAPTLAAASAGQLEDMAAELAPAGVTVASVALHELPLTARLVGFDEDQATVEVWTVTVIMVADVAAPRQVWRTVTVDLVWERGDWRVDHWATAAGPTPGLAVNAPIATTTDMRVVTSWRPAGGG